MKNLMVVMVFALVHLNNLASCCKNQEHETPKLVKPNAFSLRDTSEAEWFLNALIACKDIKEVQLSLAEFVAAYENIHGSSDLASSPENGDSDKNQPKG